MNKKLKISPFINKLYQIINEPLNKQIVRWNKEGKSFQIVNHYKFCSEILPSKFKTSVFSSFVRQLNVYDFHKTRGNHNEVLHEFENAYFTKQNPEMLCYIKRKKKAKTSSLENDPFSSVSISASADIDMDNNQDEDDPEITDDNPHTSTSHNEHQIVKTYQNQQDDKNDLEDLQQKTIDISSTLSNLQRRINILEGKHDFLDLCQSDLGQRNSKIRMELYELTERERNLQSLFSYVIQNVCPKMKLNDTVLQANPHLLSDNPNDLVNQIYNSIPFYYNDPHNSLSHIEYDHLLEMIKKTGNNKGSFEANSELRYFGQVKDFQKKYINNLEESSLYGGMMMNNDVDMGMNGIVNGLSDMNGFNNFNGLHDVDMNDLSQLENFGMGAESNLYDVNINGKSNVNCFEEDMELPEGNRMMNGNSGNIGSGRGSNLLLKFKTTKDND